MLESKCLLGPIPMTTDKTLTTSHCIYPQIKDRQLMGITRVSIPVKSQPPIKSRALFLKTSIILVGEQDTSGNRILKITLAISSLCKPPICLGVKTCSLHLCSNCSYCNHGLYPKRDFKDEGICKMQEAKLYLSYRYL